MSHLKIPPGVSEHLVKQLEQLQEQILILIQNHNILKDRLKKDPEDSLSARQLTYVEDYLEQFNEEQKPVLAAIRAEVKALNLAQENHPDEAGSSVKEEPMETDDNQEDIEATKSSTILPAAKVKSKMTIKDRMALVREKKKKRKKPTSNGTGSMLGADIAYQDGKDEEDELENVAKEGDYKAYVTEVNRVSYKESELESLNQTKLTFPIELREKEFQNSDKGNFMLSLNLLTNSERTQVDEYTTKLRNTKRHYRNLTYVPELREKKQKNAYNWLCADISTPPLLRTRRRNQNFRQYSVDNYSSSGYGNGSQITSRRKTSVSNSNSRASTPNSRDDFAEELCGLDQSVDNEVEDELEEEAFERGNQSKDDVNELEEEDESMTGDISQLLVDSESNSEKADGNEKVDENARPKRERGLTEKQRSKLMKTKGDTEKHLERLFIKRSEIEAELKGTGSKFTVATRKERNRQNELKLELEQMDAKIEKLQRIFEDCDSKLM